MKTEDSRPASLAAAHGSEIPWVAISAFVERLVKEPRGQRRAANLIREIGCELAKMEACEDLANATQELNRMLVRAWENRWERSRAESQNKQITEQARMLEQS